MDITAVLSALHQRYAAAAKELSDAQEILNDPEFADLITDSITEDLNSLIMDLRLVAKSIDQTSLGLIEELPSRATAIGLGIGQSLILAMAQNADDPKKKSFITKAWDVLKEIGAGIGFILGAEELYEDHNEEVRRALQNPSAIVREVGKQIPESGVPIDLDHIRRSSQEGPNDPKPE